jgi:demethylmenaquinone methyltransferase/2-methoxy-6-polyprenyl-1,4-benzoquinol methylase
LEVAEPSHPALRLGHRLYFTRVVPRIGAALSDGTAYRYLPRSVVYLPPVDALVGAVAAAGFPDVKRRTFSGGVVQLLVGTRS